MRINCAARLNNPPPVYTWTVIIPCARAAYTLWIRSPSFYQKKPKTRNSIRRTPPRRKEVRGKCAMEVQSAPSLSALMKKKKKNTGRIGQGTARSREMCGRVIRRNSYFAFRFLGWLSLLRTETGVNRKRRCHRERVLRIQNSVGRRFCVAFLFKQNSYRIIFRPPESYIIHITRVPTLRRTRSEDLSVFHTYTFAGTYFASIPYEECFRLGEYFSPSPGRRNNNDRGSEILRARTFPTYVLQSTRTKNNSHPPPVRVYIQSRCSHANSPPPRSSYINRINTTKVRRTGSVVRIPFPDERSNSTIPPAESFFGFIYFITHT